MRFLPCCMMIVREEATMELSKQEKKELLKKWKAEQNKKYLLNKTKVRQLFRFLQKELNKEPCDHTLKKTAQWLGELPARQAGAHPAGDAGHGRLLRLRGAAQLLRALRDRMICARHFSHAAGEAISLPAAHETGNGKVRRTSLFPLPSSLFTIPSLCCPRDSFFLFSEPSHETF